MLYGQEKTREMARSILPSRSRKSARESLAAVKRRSRADIRRRLRSLRYEDYDDRVDDFNHYPQARVRGGGWEGSIKDVVRERRGADHLAHFMTWAVKVTAHIEEPDARLAKIRAMLPDGLIGEHAVSHLVNLDEFTVDVHKYGARYPSNYKTNAEWKAEALAEREKRQEGLRKIVTDHRLKKLNTALKRVHVAGPHRKGWNPSNYEYFQCEFCPAPRLLLGLHDVIAFEAYVFSRDAYLHPQGKEVVNRYLENDFA